MSKKERALAVKLRDARRQIAALDEIQRATRAGCQAALDAAHERVRKAERERDQARSEVLWTLRRAAETQKHNGRVYQRIKEIGVLVARWEKQLPEGFVAAVREQTDPDFAELLEVPA